MHCPLKDTSKCQPLSSIELQAERAIVQTNCLICGQGGSQVVTLAEARALLAEKERLEREAAAAAAAAAKANQQKATKETKAEEVATDDADATDRKSPAKRRPQLN